MDKTATVVFELVIPAKARLIGTLELIVEDSTSYAAIEQKATDILFKIGTGVDIKCISTDDPIMYPIKKFSVTGRVISVKKGTIKNIDRTTIEL